MTPDLLDAEIAATAALTDKPFGVNLITMHPQLERADRCLPRSQGRPCRARRRHSAGGRHAAGEARRRQADVLRAGAGAGQEAGPLGRRCDRHRGQGGGRPYRPGVDHRCWRRRSCPRSATCRCSSPAASAAARRSLAYLEMGAAGVQLGTRFVCATEIDRPSELQAGLHPRLGARRHALAAARPALSR